MNNKRLWTLIALGLIGAFNLIFLWFSLFDLSSDEAYYWEWSRRPALCYFSKGPMVAYVIHISTYLFGHTAFAVRLPAVLLSLGTLFLSYMLSVRLFRSDLAAFISALMLAAAPMLNAGSTLMTIDVLMCFFSVLAIVLVWEALARQKPLLWLLAGVCIALAILSKFTAIVLVIGVLAFVVLSKRDRSLALKPFPYICCGIGLLAFLPIIQWNMAHHWVTFRHVAALGKIGSPGLIHLKHVPSFFLGQIVVMSPPILIAAPFGLWRCGEKAWKGDRDHLFLLCFALPVLLFYFLLSFHTEILPNWPVLGYFPAMVAAGAVIVERLGRWRDSAKARWMRAGIVFCIAFGLTICAVARFPSLLYKVGIPSTCLPTKRLEGWRELGERVSVVSAEMGRQGEVLILGDCYQTTSELAFYTKGHPVTYCAPQPGRRLSQYDFWPGCEDFSGKNAIYVGRIHGNVSPELKAAFESVVQDRPLEVVRGGRLIRSFSILRCYGFKGFPKDASEAKD